jgi:hypothetical protein
MNTNFPEQFSGMPEHRIRETLKDFWAGYHAADGHGYDPLTVQAAEQASSLLNDQDRMRDETDGANVTPGFTRILIGFLALCIGGAAGPEALPLAIFLWVSGLFLLANGFLALKGSR